MIKKQDVITFFDNLAYQWDDMEIRSDKKVNKILDNAGVFKGKKVLDVACGTGTLIKDYIKRQVSEVTGIDISPNMIELAQKKYENLPGVKLICGDVEECVLEKYDCIVVYNAFPHFPDPDRLILCLSNKLLEGGILTVAHSMSREKIDSHHEGIAKHVSNGLMEIEELSKIFGKYLQVTKKISNEEMYQITGKKI
ncbi:Methyltransferase domain-containing protein [Acetitomaculum ruminis DSM 5522]|uniref:Methyltransferase domain-containing protein n=1 Tax=Acetitomaculum ruminis DSM 5522 TaxID=1120918 RepID=A0A1I0ZSV2_9FIRM|nr:class I SAM-dependent methyltransferase [Acetitomaculum ruminis]SFB28627.1 Methyltransferase domain-containing protein [Acetitomaculum ruminis DSM 5522]